MTQEDKAKAYDEALSVAQETYTTQPMCREWLAKMFPELKESEGEKTKKEILDYIIKGSESCYDVQQYGKEKFKKWIAWLERQGEQNLAWSEEDERIYKSITYSFTHNYPLTVQQQEFVKSLKDRVQPKQEWSEEDEQYLLVCKNALEKYQTTDKWDANIIFHWLENKIKSVNPQNTWKPSDEQMDALRYVTNFDYGGYKATLVSLYEQLNKLKQ